jgi:hypothetical protein
MGLPLLTETRRALSRLEYAANVIARAAGYPELHGEAERQWYRFTDEDLIQIIAVKAVRLVSGLNAAFRLLEHAHTVEMGVILRTVDDFTDEITFLIEGHQSESPNKAQRDFAAAFFAESIEPAEELLRDRPRPDRVKRKDVRAAQGRYLNASNPDEPRKMAMAIDATLDGYVHGAYPHSMELFDPNLGGGRFRMTGTEGTPYPASYQKQLAFYISRALSLFGMVALHIGNEGLTSELSAMRDRFEESSEYPGETAG